MPESLDLHFINRWIDGPFRVSHHPLCEPFHNHTLKLFNKDVCRGCLFWYPGIIIGILSIFALNVYSTDKFILGLIMFGLVLPTIMQLKFTIPRPIKDVARLLLGISTGLTILIIFGYPDLFVRLIVLMVFIVIYVPLTIVRNKRNESVCLVCPEYPLRSELKCDGYKVKRQRIAIANTQLIIGISDINEVSDNIKSFDDI